MEQLLLRLNHTVDQANSEKDIAKNEAEQSKIHAIRLEEKVSYLDRQFAEFKQSTSQVADDYQKKLSDKQMELWKQDLSIKSLSHQIIELTEEINRLKKCKDLNESIAKLPSVCLDDL